MLLETVLLLKCLKYLLKIIPISVSACNTRNADNIPLFKVKLNFFESTFFPSTVIEWNKLDQNIPNTEGLNIFKKVFLKSF